jgi:hypothetical protein
MQTTRWRHPETAVLGGGRDSENFVAVETRALDVGAKNVDQRIRLRHRLDTRKVEVVDVGEVIEHAVELARVTLDFLGRDIQTRKASDLRHVGGCETL